MQHQRYYDAARTSLCSEQPELQWLLGLADAEIDTYFERFPLPRSFLVWQSNKNRSFALLVSRVNFILPS